MSHLVEKLKKTAITLIKERLDHLFEMADSWLMDQIDAARDPRLQQQYTEMMRFLKLYRNQFEKEYFRALNNAFARLHSPRPAPRDSRPVLKDVSFDALTLVGHDEMEQNLALESMATRCRSDLDTNLQMLQARLQALLPEIRLNADNNPLDPKVLCEALGRSVTDIPWEVKHDLIFFKLFQQYVLGDYADVIAGADAVLVDAGVLKNLSERELRQRRQQGVVQRTASAAGTGSAPVGNAGNAGVALPQRQDWSRVLQGALASLQQPRAFSGQTVLGSASERAVSLPLPDLVQLFQQLQSRQTATGTTGYWQTGTLCEQLNEMLQVKSRQEKSVHGESREFRVDEVDSNIINLVARLFEQVLDQDQLPARVKALLGRLQIPCIRIAVTDPEFLGSARHPARRLINALANAGLELDEHPEGHSDVVFCRIQSVVETILSDYQDDISLIQSLEEEFRQFMARETRRAQLVAQRMASLEEGRAKAAEAKAAVADALQQRLHHQELPEAMAAILDNVWYNYLCWVHHREGKDSFAWNKALFVVDQMLVSLLPVDSEEEAEDRVAAIEELLAAIRLGAERINFHEGHLNSWLAALNSVLAERARYVAPCPEEAPTPVDNPVASQPVNLVDRAERLRAPRIPVRPAADSAATGKVTRLDISRKAPKKPEPAIELESLPDNDAGLLQARKLAVGALMDYRHQGESVRCKLAAHIKSVDKLIFVNRAGAKLFEKSLLEVAHDINEGKLNLLEDSQLFDRALESVISSLRNVRNQAV